LCHVGDVRQYVLETGDQLVPSGRLHAPRIELPRDTQEREMHSNVEGSPYSANPGKLSLQEAADKNAEDAEKASARHGSGARVESNDTPKPAARGGKA
jgi:hypothetical protein